MRVIESDEQRVAEPVCLMIGNFDGVHLGHQSLIDQARELAERHGYKTAVLSFSPHPLVVLAPGTAPALLQTPEQKKALLAVYGVDYYVEQRFDQALSRLEPEEFVKRLRRRIDFRYLLVGFNFRFGYRRRGTPETLVRLGEKMDFRTVTMQAQMLGGEPVSSSRVRSYVAGGDMAAASRLLGRPYFLEGRVAGGDQLGGKLESPTANLPLSNQLCPKFGVYASWSRAGSRWYRSITNIGTAPTTGRHEARMETHLFDFEGDLYGQRLVLCPNEYLRGERKFPDLEALARQIGADKARRLALDDTGPPQLDLIFSD